MLNNLKSQEMKHGKNGNETILTVREVCLYFGVHHDTIIRWSNRGLINTYRLSPNGHRRFKLSDVKALLNGNTATMQ